MYTNKRITKTLVTIFTIACFTSPVFAKNTTTNEVNSTTKNITQNTVHSTNTNVNTNSSPNSSVNSNTNVVTNENTSNKTVTNTTPNSAVESQTQTQTPVTTQTQTTKTNKKETTTTQKTNQATTSITSTVKSSDANLSNLGITPHDFSGFKENKTVYNVTVPNTIKEVEVYATKKDSKASITGTGIVKLEEGDNVVKVVVTAQDGTTKTYTIYIKRLKSGEKETVNTANTEIGLDKLEITGLKLEPSFSKNVYQYKVGFEGSEKTLDIIAQANQANVKIIGNENLINGQNVITIIVTDAEETSVATYQIYANKNIMEQEALNKQFEEAQMQYQIKLWIVRVLISFIVICIIILLILIYKKTNSEEYKNQKKIVKDEKRTESKRENKSGKHSKK